MAKLSDVLDRLSPIDRALVLERLSSLEAATTNDEHAVKNFHAECRLPDTAYEALFRIIIQSPDAPSSLRTSITSCFRSFILNGVPIDLPKDRLFGRAYPHKKFVEYLSFGLDARHGTRESAQYEVTSLITHEDQLGEVHRRWGSLNFGRYLSWSTFCPYGGDPFDGIEPSAETIAAVLGLEEDCLNGNTTDSGLLLLFVYTLPPDAIPRFPTIADAYSADVWPYYFHVAHENDTYPLTVGWYKKKELPPRPEVVHEVIKFNNICKPIRIL